MNPLYLSLNREPQRFTSINLKPCQQIGLVNSTPKRFHSCRLTPTVDSQFLSEVSVIGCVYYSNPPPFGCFTLQKLGVPLHPTWVMWRRNKAGYTATLVACGWAGAVLEKVTRASGQEPYAQKAQKRRKRKKSQKR